MKNFKIYRREPNKPKDRKELLQNFYIDQKLSSLKIGKLLNLNSRYVRRLLKKNGIKTQVYLKHPLNTLSFHFLVI